MVAYPEPRCAVVRDGISDGFAALRPSPDTIGERIEKLYPGPLMVIDGEANDWTHVAQAPDGQTGYVASRLIVPAPCPQPAPAPQVAPAYAPPPVASAPAPAAPTPTGEDSVGIVNLGNKVLVQVALGTLPAALLIDTGATNMSIDSRLADKMLANGEAEESGDVTVQVADGRNVRERVIVIHRVTIGQHVLTDVKASVLPDSMDDAEGLLPYSILNQVGKFTIDSRNNKLIFG
jgi:clan AA aspartic protease (TIGR02281 family)